MGRRDCKRYPLLYYMYCIYLFFRNRGLINKRNKTWFSSQVKEEKTYAYIPDMVLKVLHNTLVDDGSLYRKIELSAQDPRNISTNIGPTPRPPTTELVALKKSRYT